MLLRSGLFVLLTLWCVLANAYHEGNHWLVGISGGFARHTGPVDVHVVYKVPNATTNVFLNGNGDDWNLGVLLGFRRICDGWLLDGELNVDSYNTEGEYAQSFNALDPRIIYFATRRYHHGPAVGLTARWGYTMAPYFIPYIVVGLETNKEKLDVTVQGNQPFYLDPIVISGDQQQVRGILGFGTDLPLPFWCEALAVRLEYRYYSMDKALNAEGTLKATTGIDPTISMALRPKFNTFRVALIWQFL